MGVRLLPTPPPQPVAESLLLSGQASDAVAPFEEAARLALHPIERHRIGFGSARALEAAGCREDALAGYREIASSRIPAYRTARAKEALKRLAS